MIEFSQSIVVWNLVHFCSSAIMNRTDESPMQGFLEADWQVTLIFECISVAHDKAVVRSSVTHWPNKHLISAFYLPCSRTAKKNIQTVLCSWLGLQPIFMSSAMCQEEKVTGTWWFLHGQVHFNFTELFTFTSCLINLSWMLSSMLFMGDTGKNKQVCHPNLSTHSRGSTTLLQ